MKKQNRKTEVPDRFRLLSWIGDLFKGLLTGSARRKVVVTLMGVVVFVTTYALILPALTLEQDKASVLPGFHLGEVITDEASARNIEAEIREQEAEISDQPDDTGQSADGDIQTGDSDGEAPVPEKTGIPSCSGAPSASLMKSSSRNTTWPTG